MWGVALQAAPGSTAPAEHAFDRLGKKTRSDERPERVFACFDWEVQQAPNLVPGEAYFRHFHEDELNSGPHILYFGDLHPTLLPVHVWGNAWLG
jgi:hypothetical protein